VLQDVLTIVDEVGDAKFPAVFRLVGSFEAETQVAGGDSRAFEKALMDEPSACLFLHGLPRLRYKPHATVKVLDDLWQNVEHAIARRSSKRILDRSANKRGVAPIRSIRSDDYSADIDA